MRGSPPQIALAIAVCLAGLAASACQFAARPGLASITGASPVAVVAPPAPAPTEMDIAPSELPEAVAEAPAAAEAPAIEADAEVIKAAWQPLNVPREPFDPDIERWRPLVRALLAEAFEEGRMDGPASRLDDDLVLAVIEQESGGDPEAESPAGAIGLMQVMPLTFAELMTGNAWTPLDRAAIWDVPSNMRAGLRYLAMAMQEHDGNLYWALASYNAGIGATIGWRQMGLTAVPAWGGYEETANYAPAILNNYRDHRPGLEVHIPAPAGCACPRWTPPPPPPPAPVRVAPAPVRPAPARPVAPAARAPQPAPARR